MLRPFRNFEFLLRLKTKREMGEETKACRGRDGRKKFGSLHLKRAEEDKQKTVNVSERELLGWEIF